MNTVAELVHRCLAAGGRVVFVSETATKIARHVSTNGVPVERDVYMLGTYVTGRARIAHSDASDGMAIASSEVIGGDALTEISRPVLHVYTAQKPTCPS